MNLFSEEDIENYQEDGYIIVRNLFTEEEINLLGQTARADNEMDKSSNKRDDGEPIVLKILDGLINPSFMRHCTQ
tara:strand:- start:230 stop:454 length:225 start_codon:yes stop_codon:yes gene_type:complete